MADSINWLSGLPGAQAYNLYRKIEPLKTLWNVPPRSGLLPENEPPHPGAIRVVAISDTHSHPISALNLPKGDLLIHCGDLTLHGTEDEMKKVNEEFGLISSNYKKIIVISGNHDTALGAPDPSQRRAVGQRLLSNAHYLLDEDITLFGIKFYGSPWIPPCPGGPHVFVHQRGSEMDRQWARIPVDTNVLITHAPPLGVCDVSASEDHEGDLALTNHSVNRVKPRFHVFGHMHGSHGVVKNDELIDTTFVNAAICYYDNTLRYRPILFDIPLPLHVSKDSYCELL